MRKIYWYNYEPQHEELVASAMSELVSLLAQPPTEVLIGTEPFSSAWESDVLEILSKPQDIDNTCENLSKYLTDHDLFDDVRILVMCCRSHALAKTVRENNPIAEWGGKHYQLAVVWHEDKYAIWHEALHLINARDCYADTPPHSRLDDCDLPTCIMQHVPNQANVGHWPFLCSVNISLLCDADNQYRARLKCPNDQPCTQETDK